MLVEHRERVVGVAVDEVIDVQPLRRGRLADRQLATLLPGGIVYAMGDIDSKTVLLLDIPGLLTQVLV